MSFVVHPDSLAIADEVPLGANAEVVALARRVLAMAESGEIRAIGVVAAHVGNCDGTSYELGDAGAPIAVLTLACERLRARLLEHEE